MSNKISLNDNEKNKCSSILKKIFGNNFYFVHESVKLEPILESGKIKIATELDEKYINHFEQKYINHHVGSKYAYCWVKFDDIPVECGNFAPDSFFISPIILLNENIIFNSKWAGDPIQTEDLTNTKINHIINNFSDMNEVFEKSFFSVYLNKDDSRTIRLKKLKKIKKYISYKNSLKSPSLYPISHEFLFPNGIDLKKYLIGMNMGSTHPDADRDKPIWKILKDKYPNVKLFGKYTSNNIEYFPKLMDICP
jgi:hypothetical protein